MSTGDKRQKLEAFETSDKFVKVLVSKKAESLIPADGRIFVAQRDDKIADVWKGLIKHNFMSVPVLQKTKSKYYGFVDIADIVEYLITLYGTEKLNVDQDFWELYSREDLWQTRQVNDIMKYPIGRRNPFHPVSKGYSLFSVIEILAREKGLHRVPVVDENQKLSNMITQSQIISFLNENIQMLGSIKDKPLSHFVGKDVWTVTKNTQAIDAFRLMTTKNVTGLAVIDDSGVLVDNISLRDLKAIMSDSRMFWRLFQTIHNFLEKIKKDFPNHQRPRKVIAAKANNTIADAIKMLAENHIHRVFVVDDSKRPAGVISIKDILMEIVSSI